MQKDVFSKRLLENIMFSSPLGEMLFSISLENKFKTYIIMQQNQTGSKAYLIRIVMVAVLGGLLFGYDTAVISGAEKGLQAFFMGEIGRAHV